ncbi:WecB/TagA/CpsF family glycosyltransferase [Bacillus solimangrovi]|uniref:N-acetylglucosaminyldiphosphoundecaprenol N-acetyl-beta-D-mannosaminyltransferase n=1 Tax=Bacillus solimangrovi TaxID=1305675 RepID=A0A1E5LDS6_9BACI|nr:WecB/TagA/CpsF family glycosyltransferase [Bacillus solimangrovi]OEH92179.1 acetylglucosaminyldiphospho-UDP acetyl-beta-D-mannosaminyltransferase [Bacillus solimangrovi]
MEDRYVSILGVPFLYTTMKQMTNRVVQHWEAGEKSFIITANPEIVMKAYEEKSYMDLVQQSDYVVADGIGVVKGAQLLGTPLPERVAGYDLMHELFKKANEDSRSVYMLGAGKDVIGEAVEAVKKQYSNVNIVGSHHGFFDIHDESIVNEIKDSGADLILVALGCPRQEQWIAQHMGSFSKGVFIGVGGSFDVLAGKVERAPMIWQKMNAEWLYRLVKQPSRWKRMMALPRFAGEVVKHKVTKRNG